MGRRGWGKLSEMQGGGGGAVSEVHTGRGD